ncbi:MAG: MBL fold metallo-hydrolase [Actinomycetota bacterium]|nr:MBL fold metallo-hydrolase [Actinomycetota bacterium]
MTVVELPGRDVTGIRAANPGPFTLSGTNSWVVAHDPAWVVDPGPARPDHLEALSAEAVRRGGLAGIALTHDHPDHAEAVPELRRRFPEAKLAAARGPADMRLEDGLRVGPFQAVFTPGHAPDHFAFVAGSVGFSGDAVLGEGSVFIAPDPGALAGYLEGLARLRGQGLELLCPGHGPPVEDPAAKIDDYIAHRLNRERRLLGALERGARSTEDLLDAAWADVPAHLRAAATVTLASHLDKLADEGRLPDGVQRPPPLRLSQPAAPG